MASSRKSHRRTLLPGWLTRPVSFLFGPGRPILLWLLLAAIFFGGWRLVWAHARRHVLTSRQYVVTPDKIQITPLPEWIHVDVRAEVFRDASLDGPLSVLDDELAARIGNAFSLHPWIAKVQRVTKRMPARVLVDLVYRRPACMVEVPGDLLPVDAEGVLLPGGEFSPVEKQLYPRLVGVDTRPIGPVGQRWGDGRVVGGAEIAAAIGPKWRPMKLDRVVPLAPPGGPKSQECAYELRTRGGTRIYWGLAPNSKVAGELSAAEKVGRLDRYITAHGTLDGRDGPQQLDIRLLPN